MLGQKLREHDLIGQAICAALNEELAKFDFKNQPPVPAFAAADFKLERDAYSGEHALVGVWRNDSGHKIGQVVIHGDGSFHAEYDVIKPHPGKRQWFVEAVTAWGKRDLIKSEPRLLPINL